MKFIRKILNPQPKKEGDFFIKLEGILGFKTKKKHYYIKAFTHRSMNKKDEKGNPINYERLEFVGDAMLGAIIADHLFKVVPQGNEGYLTKMRSKIVRCPTDWICPLVFSLLLSLISKFCIFCKVAKTKF